MRTISFRPSLLAGLALALASCVGSIGAGAPTPPPSGGNTPVAQPGGGTTTKPTPGPGGPAACGAGTVWRTTLLTRGQYINTVSDLLGFDVSKQVTFADTGSRKFRAGVYATALQTEERLDTAEAIAAAATTPTNLAHVLGCDPTGASEAACTGQFLDRFVLRAFRRPPDAAARADLRQLYDAGYAAGGAATGIEWAISGALQSVEFLYHLAPTPVSAGAGAVVPLDAFALAERLAYFLWDSAPDDELLGAAMDGQLANAAAVEGQVKRMIAHPRAARMRENFYRSWLELDNLGSLTRNDPAFTPAFAAALTSSLLAEVHAIYQNGGQSETLFGDSNLFVDGTLAAVYGGTGGATLAPAAYDPKQRHGLLTHPALMTLFADADASDPIRRGKFVATRLFCQDMPQPADDIPMLPPLRQGLSTRQRLEQHRAAPACAACHALFDPLGLAFESYDFLGRYRTQDHGVAVDTSGTVTAPVADVAGPFADGMELVGRIAKSGAVRGCLARQWFEYAVSGDEVPAESCALDAVTTRFAQNADLNDLLVAIAASPSFRNRLVEE